MSGTATSVCRHVYMAFARINSQYTESLHVSTCVVVKVLTLCANLIIIHVHVALHTCGHCRCFKKAESKFPPEVMVVVRQIADV